MKMLRFTRAVLTFYLNFLAAAWAVTAICLYIFHTLFDDNGWSTFVYLFWFKAVSLALSCYFVDIYRKKEYYYYFNLGLSKRLLWSVCLTLDAVLFLVSFILTT